MLVAHVLQTIWVKRIWYGFLGCDTVSRLGLGAQIDNANGLNAGLGQTVKKNSSRLRFCVRLEHLVSVNAFQTLSVFCVSCCSRVRHHRDDVKDFLQ